MFHGHDNRPGEPSDLDHNECLLVNAGIRNIDDFSIQLIFSVKLHKDLHRVGYVRIAYSKSDPAVSHISRRLLN
jgi:hypothetical protein